MDIKFRENATRLLPGSYYYPGTRQVAFSQNLISICSLHVPVIFVFGNLLGTAVQAAILVTNCIIDVFEDQLLDGFLIACQVRYFYGR